MNKLLYFSIYIIILNLLGFFIMLYDKQKAKKNQFRISEKSIFIIALLGGALGVYIGMYTFRHKTKHLKFTVLIPVLIVTNIICIWYIVFNIIL